MSDFDKQYWKIKDFAEHFGLDKSTVYNQIERGEIRAIRVGRTALRIPTDEVKRVLESFVTPHEQPRDLDGRAQEFQAPPAARRQTSPPHGVKARSRTRLRTPATRSRRWRCARRCNLPLPLACSEGWDGWC